MLKLYVLGKSREKVAKIKRRLKASYIIEKAKPEIVLVIGGDGSFLYAERHYPGIPKLIVRDSKVCKKCINNSISIEKLEECLKSLDSYNTASYKKLEAELKGKRFLCTNDFIIRNLEPGYAIRFSVELKGKLAYNCLIGDGIVVSSNYGSTGYFYSITKTSFKKGIGIAFNNITRKLRKAVVPEDSVIIFRLLREKAVFCYDNAKEKIRLLPGDKIVIRASKKEARIIIPKKA